MGTKNVGWRERSQDIRKAKKDKGIYDRSLWWDKDGGGPVYLNHFSTDIKAAWNLVEKFKLCIGPWGDQWTAIRFDQILTDGERNMAPTRFAWRHCFTQGKANN